MNLSKQIVYFISLGIANIALIIMVYYFIISIFGVYRKKVSSDVKSTKSFALIVAAHNEEAVIKDIVVSLNKLEYPKELYDVFVIADNCNDNTAQKARSEGAIVYERHSKDKKGKGFALEWMFKKIFKMDKKYDAIAIFDADNLVSCNFLIEMNKKMCEGYKVVQGYLDSKNPNDTWITGSYSIAFWQSNRMIQLARNNLGLSNQLGGTGFCVETEILEKLGWGATCLTEDLEFTCKLVLNGEKVGWAHDAVIFDEKPLTLKQSWFQRKRWMQGFADVSSRYFFKLLKKGFKERSMVAIDCAIYSMQPFITIILGLSFLVNGVNYIVAMATGNINKLINIHDPLSVANVVIVTFILPLVYTLFFLLLDKKVNVKVLLYYLIYPIYSVTWIPISIQGIIHKNDKEWSHTVHTRSVDISDFEKAN